MERNAANSIEYVPLQTSIVARANRELQVALKRGFCDSTSCMYVSYVGKRLPCADH